MFVWTFILYSEITDTSNITFHKRFGSFFSEFKNNKGYLSSIYYSIFFLRRLVYCLSQVYLNYFPFVQSGINIGFSAIQTIHLLYYRPFKQSYLLLSSTVGEISCLIALCLATFFIQDISTEFSYVLETIIIYTIITGIGIQFIISLYSIFKFLNKLFQIVLKYNGLKLLHSFNQRNQTFATESTSPKKKSIVRVKPLDEKF